MTYPVEVWIVMNESGEYVVAGDEETGSERAEDLGEDEGLRFVKLKIKLAPPDDDVTAVQTLELPSIEMSKLKIS